MKDQRISADELSKKLASSRKIMAKVNTGDFKKGNINEELLKMGTEEILEPAGPVIPFKRSVGASTPERINQSKLPDAIKKAMLENPIPQISLNDTLDMDFINKTRKLIQEDESVPIPKQTRQIKEVQTSSYQYNNVNELLPLIENMIRKVMDEKLTQILSAAQTSTINENLVLKVGNSIFQGKITQVKKSK